MLLMDEGFVGHRQKAVGGIEICMPSGASCAIKKEIEKGRQRDAPSPQDEAETNGQPYLEYKRHHQQDLNNSVKSKPQELPGNSPLLTLPPFSLFTTINRDFLQSTQITPPG